MSHTTELQIPSNHTISTVDVSAVAAAILISRPFHIEVETFGVIVTRRPIQDVKSLTPYERARLLDLLVNAKESITNCGDEPVQFDHWLISSDCRDNKPRNHWVEMTLTDGKYVLNLTTI